jgi:hypothetical protein
MSQFCQHVSFSSKKFEDNLVLRRCRACGMVSVEGSDIWIFNGPTSLDHLRKLAKQRDEDKAREHAMLHSPTESPWWEPLAGA